jgi:hypothetical protein
MLNGQRWMNPCSCTKAQGCRKPVFPHPPHTKHVIASVFPTIWLSLTTRKLRIGVDLVAAAKLDATSREKNVDLKLFMEETPILASWTM